jgi:hypothetical protein
LIWRKLTHKHIFLLNLSRITRLSRTYRPWSAISFRKAKNAASSPRLKQQIAFLDLIFHQLYRRLLESATYFCFQRKKTFESCTYNWSFRRSVYTYFEDLTHHFERNHSSKKVQTYILYSDRKEIDPEKVSQLFATIQL